MLRRAAVVGVLVVGAIAGLLLSGVIGRDNFDLSIEPGAAPKMTAESVAAEVREQLGLMEAQAGKTVNPVDIVSVTLTGASEFDVAGARDPHKSVPSGYVGPFWVVTARGTFYVVRVPEDVSPKTVGQGYFVYDDATGVLVGWGTTDETPR